MRIIVLLLIVAFMIPVGGCFQTSDSQNSLSKEELFERAEYKRKVVMLFSQIDAAKNKIRETKLSDKQFLQEVEKISSAEYEIKNLVDEMFEADIVDEKTFDNNLVPADQAQWKEEFAKFRKSNQLFVAKEKKDRNIDRYAEIDIEAGDSSTENKRSNSGSSSFDDDEFYDPDSDSDFSDKEFSF